MKKLNCFIACSFESKEVDSIYQNGILPVLRKLEISPLRVDKINHNKRIDSKILELIKDCDFGIADLTYARPSVYFEAGNIEGLGKNVIYLCRKDHFRPKESDTLGNEKIHFDLITKNIIGWSFPSHNFKSKLKSRIRLIAKPIIKEIAIQNELEKEREKFLSLPLYTRLSIIENNLKSLLFKNKYQERKDRHTSTFYVKGNKIITFNVSESTLYHDLLIARSYDKSIYDGKSKKVIRIFCSLKATPKSRIEKALGFYMPKNDNEYVHENRRYIFINSINSERTFSEELKSMGL